MAPSVSSPLLQLSPSIPQRHAISKDKSAAIPKRRKAAPPLSMQFVTNLPGITFTLPSSSSPSSRSSIIPQCPPSFDPSEDWMTSSGVGSDDETVGPIPKWLSTVARRLVQRELLTSSINLETNSDASQYLFNDAPLRRIPLSPKDNEVSESSPLLACRENVRETQVPDSKRSIPESSLNLVNTPPLTPMLSRPRDISLSISSNLAGPHYMGQSRALHKDGQDRFTTQTPPASPPIPTISLELEASQSNNSKKNQKRNRSQTLPSSLAPVVTPLPPPTTLSESEGFDSDKSSSQSKKRKKLLMPNKPISMGDSEGYLSTCYSCQNDYLSPIPVARSFTGRHSMRRAAAMISMAHQHASSHPPASSMTSSELSLDASFAQGLDIPLCPVCSDLFERHGLRCTACYFVPAENIVDDGQVTCERCFGGTYGGSRR